MSAYDALIEQLALFFGLSVLGMHQAAALALYAFGAAAFVGMVLGDHVSWLPAVATLLLTGAGALLLQRVEEAHR